MAENSEFISWKIEEVGYRLNWSLWHKEGKDGLTACKLPIGEGDLKRAPFSDSQVRASELCLNCNRARGRTRFKGIIPDRGTIQAALAEFYGKGKLPIKLPSQLDNQMDANPVGIKESNGI